MLSLNSLQLLYNFILLSSNIIYVLKKVHLVNQDEPNITELSSFYNSTTFHENAKCLYLLFNEKQKCLYRVFNENTKCLLFHFLNALFPGLFAQKFSHLFYLRTIVLHVFQIILFHGLILHFFFIEPLSCFSLRCKQHCLILWRKYLIKAAG